MRPQTAVVLGATGMIGSYLVKQLLDDEDFSIVRVLVRKPLNIKHPKLEVRIIDFDSPHDFRAHLGTGDCIFCCIGTTMKRVGGDKIAYRKVDYDIAVNAAKYGHEAGFDTYILVSSVGANPAASNFYLRLKGEVERAIRSVGFNSLYIFQPSMLLGNRAEYRFAESMLQGVMKAVSFLLFGSWRKYHAVQGSDLAKAMIIAAKNKEMGDHVYQYDAIEKLIARN